MVGQSLQSRCSTLCLDGLWEGCQTLHCVFTDDTKVLMFPIYVCTPCADPASPV